MDYFVYKTKKEKDTIIEDMHKVRSFIYGDDDISCISKGIKLIPYSDIKHDRGLVKDLKSTAGQLWIEEETDTTYLKRYDECNSMSDKFYMESIIFNMMFCNSGDIDDIYLPIFFSYVYGDIECRYLGLNKRDTLTTNLARLGLLAFSNSYDYNINNDLAHAALYNRNSIKEIYEDIMGESSFEHFYDLCKTYSDKSLYPKSIEYKDFYSIIELLKKYFYLKVDKLTYLTLNERNSMIIRFNDQFNKIINSFEEGINELSKNNPFRYL